MTQGKKTPPKPYVDFKKQAIALLERFLNYTLHVTNSEFSKALQKSELFYSRMAVMGKGTAHIADGLMQMWEPEIQATITISKRMKRASYVLSRASEDEALARVLPNFKKPTITKNDVLASISGPTHMQAPIEERVKLAYEDQAHKIARAIRIGIVLKEDPTVIIRRIRRSYPKLRIVKPYKHVATPKKQMKEADPKITKEAMKDAIDADFYDESEWNDMVDFYKETELSEGRFGEQLINEEDNGEPRYKFQIEQEETEDFVWEVLDGASEAANQQGIDDFVWNAVIDKRTCEKCCEKRDGLLVSEIEAKLKSVWKSDECQATTPPAHPNCRCQVLPVASEYLPMDRDVNFSGIDEWLKTP